MIEYFVDANVFLRYLTNDRPAKARKAETLFKRAVSGKLSLKTSLLVIAEIVWTLESFYRLGREEIADSVGKILNTPNLDCPDWLLILQALDLYVTKNIDFIDAYHAALLKDTAITQIITYDKKHFGRIEWLEVVEP